MYGAKGKQAGHVYPIAVKVERGELTEIRPRKTLQFPHTADGAL